jgi:hypothetical protein
MADRPILFSAPMVRALIAGTKTQTRRGLPIAAGLQGKILDFVKVATDKRGRSVFEMKDKAGQHVYIPGGPHLQTPHFIPRIAVGDRLYVREHWRVSQKWDETAPRDLPRQAMTVFYKAGGSIANQRYPGDWRPSDEPQAGKLPEWAGRFRQAMHMPKWASRITLIVTDVRVERLQWISIADAKAEGVFVPEAQFAQQGEVAPRLAYAALWDQINGPGAWDADPWVVAYSFRCIHQNIDEIEKEAA